MANARIPRHKTKEVLRLKAEQSRDCERIYNERRDALDAIVAGQAPNPSETHAIGCTIKWKR